MRAVPLSFHSTKTCRPYPVRLSARVIAVQNGAEDLRSVGCSPLIASNAEDGLYSALKKPSR